jgi:hypothetical protein
MMALAIECAITVVVTMCLLPVVEYLLHRLVMHHETPLAGGVYHRHAVLHHRHGRTDVNIDLPCWFAVLFVTPLVCFLLLVGCNFAAGTLGALAVVYAKLWTGLHRNFHGVGGRWTGRLPGYASLRRHHLTHHAYTGRNFGTVFGPLVDRAMGTWASRR